MDGSNNIVFLCLQLLHTNSCKESANLLINWIWSLITHSNPVMSVGLLTDSDTKLKEMFASKKFQIFLYQRVRSAGELDEMGCICTGLLSQNNSYRK